MNHHNRKNRLLPGLVLALSLSGCHGEKAFEIPQTYEVTITSTGEGEISPATNSVFAGESSSFHVMPFVDYNIHSVSVTEGDCPLNSPNPNDDGSVDYTVDPVNSDCTVNVTFEESTSPKPALHLHNPVSMTVFPTDGGSIRSSEDGLSVKSTHFFLTPGESRGFWVKANENYHFDKVSVTDPKNCNVTALDSDGAYSIKSISGKCEMNVDFVEKRYNSLTPYYDINFNVVGDGEVSINPLPLRVLDGDAISFSVTPTGQSRIVKVTDNNCSISTTDTDPYFENHYTSGPVQSDCTITIEAEKYYTINVSTDNEGQIQNINVFDEEDKLVEAPLNNDGVNNYDVRVSSGQYITFEAQSNSDSDDYGRYSLSSLGQCGVELNEGVYTTNSVRQDCSYYIDFARSCHGNLFTSMEDIQALLDRTGDENGTTIVLNNATIRKAVINTNGTPQNEYKGLLSAGRNIIFDTSCVTDMSALFRGEYSFNEDISDWDTSNVTDMSYMFSTCVFR